MIRGTAHQTVPEPCHPGVTAPSAVRDVMGRPKRSGWLDLAPSGVPQAISWQFACRAAVAVMRLEPHGGLAAVGAVGVAVEAVGAGALELGDVVDAVHPAGAAVEHADA